MMNAYNMKQQQQGAMGMGMGGQYAHYGYQQGPSQHYGSYGGYFQNNVFECNAWQAYQFGTQDELQQVFMMEVSKSPETAAREALQAEDLMNVMNNTHGISDYYGTDWSIEMCSNMIAMLDHSGDGFMQWPEFLELQTCLVCWFNVFTQYANIFGFIEAHELVNIIGELFVDWSIEMCSNVIAILDHSGDGFMQWPEFLELQTCLVSWFNVFMQYANIFGFIEAHELVNIIRELFGYQLQPITLTTLVNRYARVMYDQYSDTEETLLAFDDFVSFCVWLRAGSNTGVTSFLMDESWRAVLESEFQEPYFKILEKILELEYQQGKNIFPPKDLIFNALNLTPLDKVKVVILGQDPYHDDGQAMGLSFSVPEGMKLHELPKSLQNICEELIRDPEISVSKKPDHGSLKKWAKDGVLLLNAILTVEAHKPCSHESFGWQKFTDHVIKTVSDCGSPAVFMLWGVFAHKKEELVDKSKHKVIKRNHPVLWSFTKSLCCRCFSECNRSLIEIGQTPIDWSL